jgi:hypothetical protein
MPRTIPVKIAAAPEEVSVICAKRAFKSISSSVIAKNVGESGMR